MLEDAKVVTSKFLELRDNLDRRMDNNRMFSGNMRDSLNILELRIAFRELCELLHELAIGKNNT